MAYVSKIYRFRDTVTDNSVVGELDEAIDVVHDWFAGDAYPEWDTMIDDLRDGIVNGAYIGDLLEGLALEVEEVRDSFLTVCDF